MPAREITKIVQDDQAFRLEVWAQVEVLTAHLRALSDGIQAARAAGAMFATMEKLMATFQEELERLGKAVEGITAVVPATIALIGDLAGKFKANANDPSRVTELANKLDEAKVALATAVASGTVAATEVPPSAPTDPAAAAAPPEGGTV